MDPTPYISDQRRGEQWYLDKMSKLAKIPNNQAPVTEFWNKQTVDWLSDNRWKELHRHGMHGQHLYAYFKKYDRCHQYRDWPAHREWLILSKSTGSQNDCP